MTLPRTTEERAVALAGAGLAVFPCREDKAPSCPDGFKVASRDPDEVRRLWREYPGTLIGVATGRASGIDALDIDPHNGGDVWLDECEQFLVDERCHQTRSGGRHYIFKHHEGVRNSAGRIAPGIDVRGDGGYIIWWPMAGCPVLNDDDARLWPDDLVSLAMKPVERAVSAPVSSRPALHDGGTPYGLRALENECYEITSAGDGRKHAALNKAAYSIGGLVASGDLDEGVARSSLRASLNSIRGRCRDFRAAERTLQEAFQAGMSKPRQVERMQSADSISGDWAPLLKTMSHDVEEEPEPDEPDPDFSITEKRLLSVGGFIGDFIEHATRTARRPQPVAALAAAITLVGSLAGRRYCSPSGLYTNLYVTTLIDSGGGKDHARKLIKEIVATANLSKWLGGEDIASGAAINTALSTHPVRLYMIDEAGDFLAQCIGKKASQHKAQIAQKLKILSTSANTVFLGTDYANAKERPREDVWNPVVSIYGTSTPSQFWNAVAGASLHDGLMARFLLFEPENSYPDTQSPDAIDLPASLIGAARLMADGPKYDQRPNLEPVMIDPSRPATPFIVPFGMGSNAVLSRLEATQDELLKRYAGTYVTSLCARIAENAIKLAMIRAISNNPASPIISPEDMSWGGDVAIACFQKMRDGADRYAAENDNQARVKLVLDCIRKTGKEIPLSKLYRALNGRLTIRERDEAIKVLDDEKRICVTSKTGAGAKKPTTFIRLIG